MTRARIRRAARVCFAKADLRTVSLEDIAAEAGIGRATLYLYYPNKTALLSELIAQNLRATDRIYGRLLDLPAVTLSNVRDWVAAYVNGVRENNDGLNLFYADITLNEEVWQLIEAHRWRTIAALGQRYPALDVTIDDEGVARRKCEAVMAIATIEHFCGAAARPDFQLDRDAGIDILAEHLLALLARG